MPRACVIVLDAVGAGELPDAAEWGDEGSDTLGNVARAVGGLDLPNLEALGLGNIEPLEGCPPQPGAPAIAGRLLERSKGKDTTAGHWEMMGVVTAVPFPTYPYGFPDEVIDPFMNRTGRGVLCNKPASGTEVIQEFGEQHQKTGKWIVYTSADSVFQIAAHEETIPLEELYDACRAAREILTGKHAVGRVIARPFIGDAGPLRAHAEPARLLARAAAAELPDRHPRRREHDVRRREDQRHLRRLRHRRVVPDEVQRRRHQPHDRAAREHRRRDSSSRTSSRPISSGATATTPSTSTAACRTSTAGCRTSSRRSARATSSSSRPITAATRRPRRATTPASTRCSSRTRPDGTQPGACTRTASSVTSARRCPPGSGRSTRARARRARRSSSDEPGRPRRSFARSTRPRRGSRRGGRSTRTSKATTPREVAFAGDRRGAARGRCSRSAAGRAS